MEETFSKKMKTIRNIRIDVSIRLYCKFPKSSQTYQIFLLKYSFIYDFLKLMIISFLLLFFRVS